VQDEYLTKSEVGGKETAPRSRVVMGKHLGLLERGLVMVPRRLNRSEERAERGRATIIFPRRLAHPAAWI